MIPRAFWRNIRLSSQDKALFSGLGLGVGLVAGVAEFMGNGFIKGVSQLLISAAVVVVALLVAVAVARHPKRSDPDNACVKSPAKATVKFDDLEPSPIKPGAEFDLSGTIECLPRDHRLFIISRTFANNADYFVVEGDGVKDRDGRWNAHDGGVGSPGDARGTRFKFIAVDADGDCQNGIFEALTSIEDNGAHRVKKTAWPASCEDGVLSPFVVVTLG